MKTKHLTLIFVAILLVGGFGLRNIPFTQGDFDSNAPPVIVTVDNFYHTIFSKYFYNEEDARYFPDFWMAGEKTLNVQPPLLFVFQASFAKLNSISLYDSFFLLICLFSVLTALNVFLLLRKYFSLHVAFISLAFSMFPAVRWMLDIVYGFSLDIFAFFLCSAAVYFMIRNLKLKTKTLPVFIGILLSVAFLTHVVEAIYTGLFYGILLLIQFKDTKKSVILRGSIVLITFLISIAVFLPLLPVGFGASGGDFINLGTRSSPPSYISGNFFRPLPGVPLLLLSLLGIVMILFSIKKINKNQEKRAFILYLAVSLFIASSWLFGVNGQRTARMYHLLFPFLTFLPALGLHFLLKSGLNVLSKNKLHMTYLTIAACVGIALIFFNPTFTMLKSFDDNAHVNQAGWEAIEFLRDNTPESSVVFALNGYVHEFISFSERVSFKGDLNLGYTQENFQNIATGTLPETYIGEFNTWNQLSDASQMLVARHGLDFEYAPFNTWGLALENEGGTSSHLNLPITFFDYVVVKYNNDQAAPISQYFLTQMENSSTLVFLNDEFVILNITNTQRP